MLYIPEHFEADDPIYFHGCVHSSCNLIMRVNSNSVHSRPWSVYATIPPSEVPIELWAEFETGKAAAAHS